METKLIKDHDNYHLVNDKQFVIGTTDKEMLSCTDKMKLSLKNCEAIELDYDLDELAEECSIDWNGEVMEGSCGIYKEGFQKALEILNGKKFSEGDMKQALITMQVSHNVIRTTEDRQELIQSLQQTEWDVEIVGSGTVYKTVLDCCANYHPKFGCIKKNDCSCKNNEIPKLDADGCLILRKI